MVKIEVRVRVSGFAEQDSETRATRNMVRGEYMWKQKQGKLEME